MNIDKEVLQLIAVYAQGSSRDALSFLQQINSLHKPITLEKAKHVLGVVDLGGLMRIFDALLARDKIVIDLVKEELANGYAVNHLIAGMLKYLEDLIFIKNIGKAVSPITNEVQNKMQKQADLVDNDDLAILFKFLIEARYLSRDLEVESLPLEIALLKFGGLKDQKKASLEIEDEAENEDAVEDSSRQAESQRGLTDKSERIELEKEMSSEMPSVDIKLSKEEFEASWQKTITELKRFNHSIATFLNKANVEFAKGEILIEVPFNLYQKILTQPKNNQKIQQVIHKIFHNTIPFQIFLKDSRGTDKIKKAFGI
jgi:DNA polymerase III gamma/tau subunit